MKIRIITIMAVGVLAICVFAQEAEKSLTQKLKDIDDKVAEAQKQANKANNDVLVYKDRIVYSNAALKAVYLEMKEHEKQMLIKKQQIENEVKNLSDYRELLKKEEEAFKKLRELKDIQDQLNKEAEREKKSTEQDPKQSGARK